MDPVHLHPPFWAILERLMADGEVVAALTEEGRWLVALMLLAFPSHTVLGLCDRAYQRVRAELGPRRTFFADLHALTRYLLFASWDDLLRFMTVGLEIGPP